MMQLFLWFGMAIGSIVGVAVVCIILGFLASVITKLVVIGFDIGEMFMD
jgi:hypothetical protein